MIRRYRPEQIRFLVHWNAEVYADMDEVKKVMDHTDDLTHEQVVDTLLADMRSRGVKVAEPSDPFHDVDFIQALMHTYDVSADHRLAAPRTTSRPWPQTGGRRSMNAAAASATSPVVLARICVRFSM